MKSQVISYTRALIALILISGAAGLTFVGAFESRVTVGNAGSPFSQNKQNEPAIAVDPKHPNILVVGANDNIDMEACNAGDDTTCPFTEGVGFSGIYFSFDAGATWTQPTYTGWTARHCQGTPGNNDPDCVAQVGPIGTLPKYYENALVSNGDPAVAFGPRPGPNGFSWANGSRLYYANLTSNFSAVRSETAFKGDGALAVSRTDDVRGAAAGDVNAWMDPVIVSKQNATLFEDKEQIWADNAASSQFFGNVYVCSSGLRSRSHGNAFPSPVLVAISSDGGDTWETKQVTAGANNAQQRAYDACSVRTDSKGVVYLFVVQFQFGTPGIGAHAMVKSFDGGRTWTQPQRLFSINDACYNVDPVQGRCVEDGVAGARNDLTAAPSIDIANGAPSGADATDEIVDVWADGDGGLNQEKVMLSYSTNGGNSFAAPVPISPAGERGYYAAGALSPNGKDLYVVYNAFTTPYRNNTSSPRNLVGVVKHADIGSAGVPSAFTELHRSPGGDPRGSSTNSLIGEFLGDYVYAVATRSYGAGVWNDVRNAADCPAIDAWRSSLASGSPLPRPAPQQDCAPTFGNTDIFGGSFPDPTP